VSANKFTPEPHLHALDYQDAGFFQCSTQEAALQHAASVHSRGGHVLRIVRVQLYDSEVTLWLVEAREYFEKLEPFSDADFCYRVIYGARNATPSAVYFRFVDDELLNFVEDLTRKRTYRYAEERTKKGTWVRLPLYGDSDFPRDPKGGRP